MCFETFQISLEKYLPNLPFNLILEFGEYRELLQKLEKGLIDMVVTPQKTEIRNVVYQPFSKENIILAAGPGTDTTMFESLIHKAKPEEKNTEMMTQWLATQKWYGITGDNEHLLRFWKLNFKSAPDFRPNYIVPNIHSIIRSLSKGPGLAVIPDFLCLDQIKAGVIKILWQGFAPLTNILYFARLKTTRHPEQIRSIEKILEQELPPL